MYHGMRCIGSSLQATHVGQRKTDRTVDETFAVKFMTPIIFLSPAALQMCPEVSIFSFVEGSTVSVWNINQTSFTFVFESKS